MKHVLAGGLKDLAFGEGSVTDGARHRRGALFFNDLASLERGSGPHNIFYTSTSHMCRCQLRSMGSSSTQERFGGRFHQKQHILFLMFRCPTALHACTHHQFSRSGGVASRSTRVNSAAQFSDVSGR